MVRYADKSHGMKARHNHDTMQRTRQQMADTLAAAKLHMATTEKDKTISQLHFIVIALAITNITTIAAMIWQHSGK